MIDKEDLEFYSPPWDSGPVDDVVVYTRGKFYRLIPNGEGFTAEDITDDPLLERLDLPQENGSDTYDLDRIVAAIEKCESGE